MWVLSSFIPGELLTVSRPADGSAGVNIFLPLSPDQLEALRSATGALALSRKDARVRHSRPTHRSNTQRSGTNNKSSHCTRDAHLSSYRRGFLDLGGFKFSVVSAD